MKVIVAYRNFHNIPREEIPPEVFKINANETPKKALERIWTNNYIGLLEEQLIDNSDPLDEENCYHEEDNALITWADGDTKEFYIVEVENYER